MKMSNNFAFILGREVDIALAELESVLFRHGFTYRIASVSKNVVYINIVGPGDKEIASLIDDLAGTIKIFQLFDRDSNLLDGIVALIKSKFNTPLSKINFGLSFFSYELKGRKITKLGLSVKKKLKQDGYSIRFVESQEPVLSSILSLKNNLVNNGVEIGIFEKYTGLLVALNNPEEWAKRDYGKPRGDKYSGMLPPKLARMMVNLALGQNRAQKSVKSIADKSPNTTLSTPDCLVVDPFCGSGNILMEALMLGCGIFGSDISEKAVMDSQENIDWLTQNASFSTDTNQSRKIIKADATSAELTSVLKSEIRNYDCLAVLTEPYLGKPKKVAPSLGQAKAEYGLIKQLYINFLRNIAQLSTLNIKPIFCLVFPLVETSEGISFSLLNDIVDEITEIGYTLIRPPLTYGRDYQVVKRQIVLLKLQR